MEFGNEIRGIALYPGIMLRRWADNLIYMTSYTIYTLYIIYVTSSGLGSIHWSSLYMLSNLELILNL